MSRPVPRSEIIGGWLDPPQVLVVVGYEWPGDDALRRWAAAEWNDLRNLGLTGDPVPWPPEPGDWHIGRCERWRWVPCDPGAEYDRLLFPAPDLGAGSFWGVICEPTHDAFERARRLAEAEDQGVAA